MENVNFTIGLMCWISVTRFLKERAERNMKIVGSLPVICLKTNRYQVNRFINEFYKTL